VDPDRFDIDNPDDWAQANPALGIRISEEYIQAERNALSDEEFRRERLGIFDPEPSDLGDLALSQDAWARSLDGRSRADGAVTFGLDVGPEDHALASLAFAGARADGLLHVEVIERAKPGEWIVDLAVRCTVDGSALVLDPSGGAAAYLPDLVAAGVPVVTINQRELAAACGRFALAVANGQVRHLGSGDLNAAVATAVKSPRGDAFKWKRRVASAPDLSPLYAVTLAAWPQDGEAPVPAIY
jgi:phage terminase large subunit-like protein